MTPVCRITPQPDADGLGLEHDTTEMKVIKKVNAEVCETHSACECSGILYVKIETFSVCVCVCICYFDIRHVCVFDTEVTFISSGKIIFTGILSSKGLWVLWPSGIQNV